MSKTKRVPLSSATLLQARNQFLTNGVEPLQATVAQPVIIPLGAEVAPPAPNAPTVTAPEPPPITAEQTTTTPAEPAGVRTVVAPTAPVPEAEAIPDVAHGVSKKALLQQYVESQKNNEADTVYLPHELYDVLITVWHTRKRQHRGIKKSHLIIEALLLHPEIIQELRDREVLK